MDVYVNGKKLSLKTDNRFGVGGEAEVWKIDKDHVIKIFKPANHPDYEGGDQKENRLAAESRIIEHQKKLLAFPSGLPKAVIVPEYLAKDKSGAVVGYTMRFVPGDPLFLFGNKDFRMNGIKDEDVLAALSQMRDTLALIHRESVVLGDLNDLNIIVSGRDAHFIDADSFQFGPYLCRNFTPKFLDPLIADKNQAEMILEGNYSKMSDWYAFNIMLMQSLLRVGPYGGTYRPQTGAKKIPHDARPLYRLTVFDKDVGYPKPAIPFSVLPDELLEYFVRVFKKDLREEFPERLLKYLRWTKCLACGNDHMRNICPYCATASPAPVIETVVIRGSVTATTIWKTTGHLITAMSDGSELSWLYHEDGKTLRDGGRVVLTGDLSPNVRFKLAGEQTLLGSSGAMFVLKKDGKQERQAVDSYGTLPIFGGNAKNHFWLSSGELLYGGKYGYKSAGNVVKDQTMFWVGEEFGLGFSRVGSQVMGFVFETNNPKIKDGIKLPAIKGRLIDANAIFSEKLCWLTLSIDDRGKIMNRIIVVERNGNVLVEKDYDPDIEENAFIANIRGKCASGGFLFSATDKGIVRLEIECGQIAKTREYPDTEPFVDSSSALFITKNGMAVVSNKKIVVLKMK